MEALAPFPYHRRPGSPVPYRSPVELRAASASTGCAAMRARACRRQPNNCWGLIPFSRATSDTHEPDLSHSTDDAGLVMVGPTTAPAGPRDQLDAPHWRDGVIRAVAWLGQLRFERMLKRMDKSIAHGAASSHSPSRPEMLKQ